MERLDFASPCSNAGHIVTGGSFTDFMSGGLDADDRILYDPATGSIYYDPDGIGGAGATLFARVTAGLALDHSNFQAL